MKIKNSKALKKYNKYTVLNEIIKRQPLSRADIKKHLDLSHTTISYLIKDLIERDFVIEKITKSTGGRPPKLVYFKGENKYIIALNFEERRIVYAIYNLNIKLVDKTVLNIEKKSINIILQKINKINCIKQKKYNIKKNQICGVGVSIPGIYKEDKDLIINSTTHYLDYINIKAKLNNIFDSANIYIANDANISVYYEWSYKLKRKYNNLIYIYVVDGIGSGIIVDDKLYTGSHGNAGEIGHMKVSMTGKRCRCGNIGCLEAISSIRAVEDDFNKAFNNGKRTILNEKFRSPFNYKEIISGYLEEDYLSKKILNRAIKYFIIALYNIINIFDPQIIILGGLFDKFNAKMIKLLNIELKQLYFPDKTIKPKIINRREEQNYQLTAIACFVFDKWKMNI